jgi:hypothetical protein
MINKTILSNLQSDIKSAERYYSENRSDLAIQSLQITNSKILLELLSEIKTLSEFILKSSVK